MILHSYGIISRPRTVVTIVFHYPYLLISSTCPYVAPYTYRVLGLGVPTWGPWFFFQGLAPPWFGSPLGISYNSGPRVPWSPDPLVACPVVLWSSGPLVLVPWSCGPLVPWSLGPLVPGPLVPWSWSCGPLVPWSSGLSILWSLAAVFGRIEILPITAYGASEKIGLQKNNDICGFESLRLLRSQETANTVFADLEMLQSTAL